MLLAEQSVIGAMLIDSPCIPGVLSMLTPDDMQLELNREIFKVIKSMYEAQEPIDPIKILDKTGIQPNYLYDIINLTPTAANVMEYADIVKKQSNVRKLREVGERLLSGSEPSEMILDVTGVIEQVKQTGKRKVLSPVDGCMKFMERRKRIDSGEHLYVRTMYSKLDELLGGGLVDTGLYLLAGRPGMGKTTVGLAIADNVSKIGEPVLLVSMEMSPDQILAKRISSITGINSNVIMQKRMSDAENQNMAKALQELSERPFHTNDEDSRVETISEIADLAISIKGLRLLVIDYFGLIRPEQHMKDRVQQMTEISNSLKRMANRLKIPVLCLAQLNRENTTRAEKRPQLSDLRETGAAEQDADGVIFLHRDDYYNKPRTQDRSEASELEVILEKNRHGATGTVKMAMYLATSKITV